MVDRFECLTTGVTRIYRSVQKIKRHRMGSMGLKGTHVMCIYFLKGNLDGLTAADLCRLCHEDKAGISRILSDLEAQGFICYDMPQGRKYRARAALTEAGKEYAEKVCDLIVAATERGGAGITEAEREVFYRVLFRIADNLEGLCGELDER